MMFSNMQGVRDRFISITQLFLRKNKEIARKIIIVLAMSFSLIGQVQSADVPDWPLDSEGFVNVNDLDVGTGAVNISLTGGTITWPEDFKGFILEDSPRGGPTLTLTGIYDDQNKPDDTIFEADIRFENLTSDPLSKVVYVTPVSPKNATTIHERLVSQAMVMSHDITGNGTIEKAGAGTFLFTGDAAEFLGDTVVREGIFAIGNDSVYGSELRMGTFTVTGGTILAFNGNATDEAPHLNVDVLKLAHQAGGGGANLLFNVAKKDQTLAIINANRIELGQQTATWYDGIGLVTPGHNVIIEISTLNNGIEIKNTSGTEVLRTATTQDLAQYFSKVLVSFQVESESNAGRTDYQLTGTVKSVSHYAAQKDLTHNQQEAAGQLDNFASMVRRIIDVKENYPGYEMLDVLYNETNAAVIDSHLTNMSKTYGIENFYSLTPHYGTAGSVFFNGGNEEWNSLTEGGVGQQHFRGQEPSCQLGCTGCTACSNSCRNGLWAMPFYSFASVAAEDTLDGYNVRRLGVVGGIRQQFDHRTKGGILLGWSAPKLNQDGSLLGYTDTYHSELKMTDIQFALHLERALGRCFVLSGYLGGGYQWSKWNRDIEGDIGLNRSFSADTTGNSLTATVYLARPFAMGEHFRLTPLIGFDSEHNWMNDVTEKNSRNTLSYPGNFSQALLYSAQQYRDLKWHRNMARVGLTGQYKGEEGGLSARLFYGTLLGGDTDSTVTATSVDGIFTMKLVGQSAGNDTLTMGCGFWRQLGAKGNNIISGNYNANYLSKYWEQNTSLAWNWFF